MYLLFFCTIYFFVAWFFTDEQQFLDVMVVPVLGLLIIFVAKVVVPSWKATQTRKH